MEKLLLSVCIPTYNRVNSLIELVDSVLKIKRDDIDIVITDNCSTDETESVISAYPDKRVKYYKNESPLPALINTVHSLFNAKGKYALLCNDRDLLFPDQLINLINYLEQGDFSLVLSPPKYKCDMGEPKIFSPGFESLVGHDCLHHPTGMVYNREIIEQFIDESNYYKYLGCIYTYDFLAIDLMKYEKSSICFWPYWGTRDTAYIRTNKAGTGNNLYFLPEIREKTFYAYINHVFEHGKFVLSEQERLQLIDHAYLFFAVAFCNYKLCLSDYNESAHYNLQPKFIPVMVMLSVYNKFFKTSISQISKYFNDTIKRTIINNRLKYYIKVIICCIKIDIVSASKYMHLLLIKDK